MEFNFTVSRTAANSSFLRLSDVVHIQLITPQAVTRRCSAKNCSSNTKSENQLIQILAKSLKNKFMKELSFIKGADL